MKAKAARHAMIEPNHLKFWRKDALWEQISTDNPDLTYLYILTWHMNIHAPQT